MSDDLLGRIDPLRGLNLKALPSESNSKVKKIQQVEAETKKIQQSTENIREEVEVIKASNNYRGQEEMLTSALLMKRLDIL